MTDKIRILKGFMAGGYGQLVTALVQLLGVPIFLNAWGTDLYGEWLLLAAIPSYLALSDVCFGSVAANEMTMHVARNERVKALECFQSTIAVLIFSTLLVLVLVAILIVMQITELRLPIHIISRVDASLIISILGGQAVFGFYSSLLLAGFRCEGNYAVGTFYANSIRLLEFIGAAATLSIHQGPVQVALAMLIIRTASTIGLYISLRRRSPWIILGLQHASFKKFRELLGPAFAYMAYPAGQALNLQGLILVVGATLGPSAVVLFSTMRTLTRVSAQAMAVINNAVWPEFSGTLGAHNFAAAKQLLRSTVRLTLWLALFSSVMLLVFGEAVFNFWSKGQIAYDPNVFAILVTQIVLSTAWVTSVVVPNAVNRHSRVASTYFFASSCAVIAAIPLTKYFGLIGTASALFVIDMILIPMVLRTALNIVQDDLKGFLSAALRPPVFLSWMVFAGKKGKR